jgi:hypothetical protein
MYVFPVQTEKAEKWTADRGLAALKIFGIRKFREVGNKASLASELPMAFGGGKTYFTIAEGRALKPIIVPGQAIDKSAKEGRMLDGQPPMNHSKWKAPPYVLWEGMVTFVISGRPSKPWCLTEI